MCWLLAVCAWESSSGEAVGQSVWQLGKQLRGQQILGGAQRGALRGSPVLLAAGGKGAAAGGGGVGGGGSGAGGSGAAAVRRRLAARPLLGAPGAQGSAGGGSVRAAVLPVPELPAAKVGKLATLKGRLALQRAQGGEAGLRDALQGSV